jgi:hypothetical protein
MKYSPIILATILLLVASLSPPFASQVAHAQTIGEVCLVQAGSSSCPLSPPVISGTVGSQLRVAVFIQNSAPLNGFDITVLAAHTILQPSGVDLTGTVLPSPFFIISQCIGGVQKVGGSCPLTATVDTIEVVAVSTPLTPTLTTGLLFTAVYNVVAATSSTPIGFQTGCSSSSVLGTTTCVLVVNGPTIDPEIVQTATFTAPTPVSASATFIMSGIKPAFKTLSISKNGDIQTLIADIGNIGTVTAFVKVDYSIIGADGSVSFQQSPVLSLGAGTSGTVSVSYAVPVLPLRYFVVGSLMVSSDGVTYVSQGTDTTSYAVHT